MTVSMIMQRATEPASMCRIATVIGNGPSLTPEKLEAAKGMTYATNRIWKMFEETDWRPTYYVRGEMPAYVEEHVLEDLKEMSRHPTHFRLQEGFKGYAERAWGPAHPGCVWDFYTTCGGKEHDWHLPEICGYGSVVHQAMQLAVLDGAEEIHLIGCDLGTPSHFYGEEGRCVDEALRKAHAIAARCCPVPIFWE